MVQATTQLPILTVEQLATQLGVSQMEVSRAIARSRLGATKVRPDAPWMITASAAEKYINSRNIEDLSASHIVAGSLNGNDERNAEGIVVEVEKSAKLDGQVLTDEAAKSLASKTLSKPGYTVANVDLAIKVTPKIAEVLGSLVPVSTFAVNRSKLPRYENWSQLYLVAQLWKHVNTAVGSRTKKSVFDTIAELYKSPDDYKAITAETITTVLDRSVVFSQKVEVDKPNGMGRTVFSIYYKLSHKLILPYAGGSPEKLAELAF